MRISPSALLGALLAFTATLAAQQSGPVAPAQTPLSPSQRSDGGPPNSVDTVHISGGVMAGQLIKKVVPASLPCDHYPSGVVVMRAIIGTDGKVQQLTLLSGSPGPYGRAVMDAVRQWEYKPYLLNGNPVKVDTTVTVEIQRNSNGCGSDH